MKVAVIGGNGQLGSDVVSAFAREAEVCSLNHSDVEISDLASVSRVLDQVRPDFIVNTAAMHNVEKCEQDPQGAFAVNACGPRNLSLAANSLGSVLIHVSTDYVFDGSKMAPYFETDTPQPLNCYGTSKLSGEHLVRSTALKHFVVRTSGLYGHQPCRAKGGLNFVELMLKLGRERGRVRVVGDEFVTPTSTAELADQLVVLSRSNDYGLYHATAEGSCSWHDFAREIFSVSSMDVDVQIAQAGEFPAKVPRPKYSVLENRALKSCGLNRFRTWQDALRTYLGSRRVQPSMVEIPS